MSTFATVDEYIAAQSPAAQPRLRELRAIIRAAVPEAEEVFRYDMPTYRLRGSNVAYFGAAKHHCALYGGLLEGLAEELSGYETSSGAVRFPLDRPIPEDLVRKLVLARVAEREAARKR
jgi:uncharacterized protein YdhG (YjbR/CyaY superfamily)